MIVYVQKQWSINELLLIVYSYDRPTNRQGYDGYSRGAGATSVDGGLENSYRGHDKDVGFGKLPLVWGRLTGAVLSGRGMLLKLL